MITDQLTTNATTAIEQISNKQQDDTSDNLNVIQAKPVGVHYKNKRKFNDAWAFAAYFISISTCIGFGIYNIIKVVREIKEGNTYSLRLDSKSIKHVWVLALINFGTVFALNLLIVILFSIIPKAVIIGGFIFGHVIAMGWLIFKKIRIVHAYYQWNFGIICITWIRNSVLFLKEYA